MKDRFEELRKKLIALGSTPDEIAQKLNELGIKGRKNKAYECVLANFCNKELGVSSSERKSVSVSDLRITLENKYALLLDSELILPFRRIGTTEPDPEYAPLFSFINNFDEGKYPTLVAEETEEDGLDE